MKRMRFSVEQIVATLKQIELGLMVAEAEALRRPSSRAPLQRWQFSETG